MPAFSPRGYKNPATTGEINDPAFWKTVGENQDARFVELDANLTGASTDAAQALSTANAYAGQIAQANTTAGSAVTLAQGAVADVDEIKGPIDTRLSAVETAAGYAPGDATDAAMTNIATQETTQFRAALNAQAVDVAETVQGVVYPAGASFGAFNHADLQAAATQASSSGKMVSAAGTITTDQTLTIKTNCDLSGLTINYTGSGAAVIVGETTSGAFISRKPEVKLPHLINVNKSGAGWDSVAGSVGVLVSNLYTGEVTVPQVKDFETGLKIQGIGAGTSYVDFHMGHLFNNKINYHLHAGTAGWVNQNNFHSGRSSKVSNEGTQVPGSRQILCTSTANNPLLINNNAWWGSSIESPNVDEYFLDMRGVDNYFIYCRWENVGAPPRVIYRADSIGNVIEHGNNASAIDFTKESGTANIVNSRGASTYVASPGALESVFTIENRVSSNNPVFRLMGAGAESLGKDKATAWLSEITANAVKGKREADAHPRTMIDHANGRFYFGDGATAPATYIGKLGNFLDLGGQSTAATGRAVPTSYLRVRVNGTQYRLALLPDADA